VLAPGTSLAAQADAATGPPAWFAEEMRLLVADGDAWLADNARYRSEQEPWDAYGLKWSWGLGNQSIRGRLYGLRDGQEEATFWEFRVFWHPGQQEVIMLQVGSGGAVGMGPMMASPDSGTFAVQTFWTMSGDSSRVRHESVTNAETHTTRSFDGTGDGWVPRRSYVWRRVR
jgi:hypothetical protein